MAALPTPRRADGKVDFPCLERVVDFALSNGARGVVPCGGTGEYFDISTDDRREILKKTLAVADGRGLVVAGVGAASIRDSVSLAEHAFSSGASAVLLPPPHFYRYGDRELLQFFRQAAQLIRGPVLLYNLAAFVSPISENVAAELIATEPHIVGIKDSSGTLDILRRLTREKIPAIRIQGHDLRLAESFRERLIDGAISGPASVVPELSAAMFATVGHPAAFDSAAKFYAEFIGQIERFPYPWALKWIAERRGLGTACLPFSLDGEQEILADSFRSDFDEWFSRFRSWRSELETSLTRSA